MKETSESADLSQAFEALYNALNESKDLILDALNKVQASSVDIGGYFKPNEQLATQAMRPCQELNAIIDTF